MPVSNTPHPGQPVRGSESGRPIMAAFDLLGRRWMLRLIGEIGTDQPRGFLDLQRSIGQVSSSVLTTRLRELDEARIATRDPGGGYVLTEIGQELLLALAPLWSWSDHWASSLGSAPNDPIPAALIDSLGGEAGTLPPS